MPIHNGRPDQPQEHAIREAIDGRMPVLSGERLYSSYGSFLWTCTSLSAATWAYLIGGNLPAVGNTLIGILGYLCGMILGLVPVTLASGLPSYRYGVDPIDGAKPAFGVNGAALTLLGSLVTLVGWAYVLVALTAQGFVSVVGVVRRSTSYDESLATAVGLIALAVVWLAARRGPTFFKRLSQYVAPGQILVTTALLVLLLYRFGPSVLWTSNAPHDQTLTGDHALGFAYAVEFGVSNSFGWWPVMGGLTRLVKRRRHILGPTIIGAGVLGAAFISAVAAISASKAGTADPTRWMLAIGGPVIGVVMLVFVLAANIVTMVILIYLAAVAAQQLRRLSRIRWDFLLILLLVPGVYFAFRTAWVLNVVMTWLSYNAIMFAGITGIMLVDYFFLRRETLDARHLFTRERCGKYWYWGGVNWAAMGVLAATAPVYFYLYSPTSFRVAPLFKYAGAGLPTMLLAGVVYLALTLLLLRPIRKGDYAPPRADALVPGSGPAVKVGL